MTYEVGKVVCLWHEDVQPGSVTVLKEVLVTITETKTGVPGEWSREPVSSISLRGIGDDGKTYEKHWDSWPESQTNCFTGQWSTRDDAEGVWVPKEAVHAHGALRRHNEQYPSKQLTRKDRNGQPILPKGDVTYCEKHDEYDHLGSECLLCSLDARKKVA
jgi:hypothetical protein